MDDLKALAEKWLHEHVGVVGTYTPAMLANLLQSVRGAERERVLREVYEHLSGPCGDDLSSAMEAGAIRQSVQEQGNE